MRPKPTIVKRKSTYQRVDARGRFIEHFNSDQGWRAINSGSMKKGAIMGNHYHKKNLSLFIVLSGSVRIVALDVRDPKAKRHSIVLTASEGALIYPFITHAVQFLEKSSFLLLKSQKFSQEKKDLFATEPLID